MTFLNEYQTEAAVLPGLIAETVTSDGDDEKHEWLGPPPQLEEFTDERKVTPLSSDSLTIKNVEYTATIGVLKKDLMNNRTGSIEKRVRQLAQVAAAHPNKVLTDLMVAGTTGLHFDGTAFYADAHTSGTGDNLLAGAGATTANLAADLAAVEAAFRVFTAENGEPFHGDSKLTMHFEVPPAIAYNMREAVNATIISSTSNVNMGIGTVRPNPRLSDANDWYAHITDAGRRGYIWQPRAPIEFEALESATESGFWKRQWFYGVAAYYGAGYGHWQGSIKVVNS
jgi:phage major head subunit gpT-like protein